ncbi:MAG: aminotransferase class V-fold PLP-dependent enzyme [Puniceicoccaceae bacterium]|nr:MAG: aminotransferase class V-fold PLP-dependent enzyme [Puniceicoccaceae bacterium]
MSRLYFDHNATTPLCPEAKAAWLEVVDTHWMNPSSPYRAAAAVQVRLEAARAELADLCQVEAERLVFCSGATEANNVVFRHWAQRLPASGRVGLSPVEHPSVLEAAKHYFGERIEYLPVDAAGRVDMAVLEKRLGAGGLAAVSIMAANNETGVLQAWPEAAQLCRRAGVPYHCDASQWVGKQPMTGMGAGHYVSGCAHNFGGPKGVGFLILPSQGDPCRITFGGGQEYGHRAGTEDVAGVLAMLAALRAAKPQATTARDAFIAEITQRVAGTQVLGEGAEHLWNTVALVMPEFSSTRWVRALEKAGCWLSSGSACSTGHASVSHVLLAMGLDAAVAGRVLRVSSGFETSRADWQALAEAFTGAYQSLREADAASPSKVISID